MDFILSVFSLKIETEWVSSRFKFRFQGLWYAKPGHSLAQQNILLKKNK